VTIYYQIKERPEDPIFGIQTAFLKDPREHKYNLGVGFLPGDDGGEPKLLSSVTKAEKEIFEERGSKNYLPIVGDPKYIDLTGKLIFGDLYGENIVGVTTVGGTSALRLGGELLKEAGSKVFSIPTPTWPNHKGIGEAVGFFIDEHPYVSRTLQFEKMCSHFWKLEEGSVVLLQPMSQNPTGVDLNKEQWKELSYICKARGLIPFFDTAYQGLGVSLDADAEPIRFFVSEGHELLVSHSYSKSMGLYNERVGALFAVVRDVDRKSTVKNALSGLIRTDYSNPPRHGSLIARVILETPALYKEWSDEIEGMQRRVALMRKALAEGLLSKGDFSYLLEGHGFFSLLNISRPKVEELKEKYGIYLTGASRINIAALNASNIEYILKSIRAIL
jgi:aspartate/tyrosine/aromatic aminotransferase